MIILYKLRWLIWTIISFLYFVKLLLCFIFYIVSISTSQFNETYISHIYTHITTNLHMSYTCKFLRHSFWILETKLILHVCFIQSIYLLYKVITYRKSVDKIIGKCSFFHIYDFNFMCTVLHHFPSFPLLTLKYIAPFYLIIILI